MPRRWRARERKRTLRAHTYMRARTHRVSQYQLLADGARERAYCFPGRIHSYCLGANDARPVA